MFGLFSTHPRRFRLAFTLVELLVVIAIIGVLTALLLPALGNMHTAALKTGCAGNLRQIGVAMQSYIADHEGRLPGPMYSGMYGCYTSANALYGNQMSMYLGPYMNLPEPTTKSVSAPIFMCPAYKASMPGYPIGPSYMNTYNLISNNWTVSAWGRPDSSGAPNTFNQTPLTMAAVTSAINPATTWAVQDADQGKDSYNSTAPQFPQKPVHKKVRNRLFFDFHVEAVPVTDM